MELRAGMMCKIQTWRSMENEYTYNREGIMELRAGVMYKIRTWRSMENEYTSTIGGIYPDNEFIPFGNRMKPTCGTYIPALQTHSWGLYATIEELGISVWISSYMVDWTATPIE